LFVQTTGEDEIWGVPTLGGATRRIASGVFVAPSVDAKFWFYQKNDTIMRTAVSGGEEELVYRSNEKDRRLEGFLTYPDGNNLLIGLSKGNDAKLQKLDLASRRLEELGRVSDMASRPTWGQPGKTLNVSRTVNGLTNLWEYSLVDRKLTQITTGAGPDFEPMSDPSGKGIYFINGKSSGALSTYHFKTKQSNDVVTEDASQPEISRDGRRVAYISILDDQTSELWVADVDGSNRIKLAAGHKLETLDWSPDGTKFVFGDLGNGICKLFVIGVDGDHLVQIPWTGVASGFVIWAPDGKSFYFGGQDKPQGDAKIWRADASGAGVTEITEKCGESADVSPDGRYLMNIVLWGDGTGLYQYSIADKKCTFLKPGVATYIARFARDGKSFDYIVTSHGETTIYRQPWQDGKMIGPEKPAFKFPFALRTDYAGNAYDLSRDLSTIVYARPGGHADLYFLSRK
jgi:Tol biopolymer transport system component